MGEETKALLQYMQSLAVEYSGLDDAVDLIESQAQRIEELGAELEGKDEALSISLMKFDQLEDELATLRASAERMIYGNGRIGSWLSASLSDSKVCDEMKADVKAWFESHDVPAAIAAAAAPKPPG